MHFSVLFTCTRSTNLKKKITEKSHQTCIFCVCIVFDMLQELQIWQKICFLSTVMQSDETMSNEIMKQVELLNFYIW